MSKPVIIAIITVVAIVAIFGLIQADITGNAVSEESVIIYFPTAADIPNVEESTVVFDFSFPPASFRVGDKSADVLMFLDSQVIKGLKVGYNMKDKKIYAGLPQISSSEVELLDGSSHQLSYSFHKGNNIQQIYLDGNLIGSGQYSGEVAKDVLTGYAAYGKKTRIESSIPINVRFE